VIARLLTATYTAALLAMLWVILQAGKASVDAGHGAASPLFTTTVYEARIDGQPVTCTETHDHQTGTRSRAC
jgi:hypothetical protein